MLVILIQVTLLLNTFSPLDAIASPCAETWWGKDCQFQCHCNNTKSCTAVGGCSYNGICVPGFFGPSCQYVDLANSQNSTSTPTYLSDHNEKTCNPQTNATSVELVLRIPSQFLWIRIHAKENSNFSNFKLVINDYEACNNERRYHLSNTTVDITCDTTLVLEKLRIVGPIARNVCSIYISGGRNVALKQPTKQSSNRNNQIQGNEAANAVDGNYDQNYDNGHCTHTDDETKPQWNLTYTQPQVLLKIVIYNRNGWLERNNKRIHEVFDTNGARIFSYQSPETDARKQFTLIFPSRVPVSQISISGSDVVPRDGRMLTICELETFGETICPDFTYGLSCDQKCPCEKYEICNQVNGLCAEPCPPGLYGYNCLYRCSEYCRDKKCLPRHGTCVGCHAGFQGDYCTTECSPGNFGEDCKLNCSKRCIDVCNYKTGACECEANFTGATCTDCVPGFYGPDCIKPCSRLCRDGLCNIVTGVCLTCVGNRAGDNCLDCPKTWFGPLCETRCSKFCLDGLCNKLTGNCPACTHQYSGPHCRYPPKKALPWVLLLIPVVVIFLLFSIVMCFCVRKRSLPVDEEDKKRRVSRL